MHWSLNGTLKPGPPTLTATFRFVHVGGHYLQGHMTSSHEMKVLQNAKCFVPPASSRFEFMGGSHLYFVKILLKVCKYKIGMQLSCNVCVRL